jgi:hypothetical protein
VPRAPAPAAASSPVSGSLNDMNDETGVSDSAAVGDDKLRRWSGSVQSGTWSSVTADSIPPTAAPWPPQPPSKKWRTTRPSVSGAAWRRPDQNREGIVKERCGFAREVGGGGGGERERPGDRGDEPEEERETR